MKVCITGGAGYVGSELVPLLMSQGHRVTILDTCWYWQDPFPQYKESKRLKIMKEDIRDRDAVDHAFRNQDAVIHLACVSNDPSFELDPTLGKSINYDSFDGILTAVRKHKPGRFIYASSSSVYGVRAEKNVIENATCQPLTDYSKYKYLCEVDLKNAGLNNTTWTVLRPATVCGYAARLRLDLAVNILTISALIKNKITVFGGNQLRPNINIHDMVFAYYTMLTCLSDKIHTRTFNVGYENHSILEIANMVKDFLPDVEIETTPSNDNRSYHINSDKIKRITGFEPRFTLKDAIASIIRAYRTGLIINPLTNPDYYNIKTMKERAKCL